MRSDPTWSLLANQLADTSCALARQITDTNNIIIYVDRAAAHHATANAFRSLLLARIAQRGFSIAAAPENVVRITYQVQTLGRSDDGLSSKGEAVIAGGEHHYRIRVTVQLHERIVAASLYPESASLDAHLRKLL